MIDFIFRNQKIFFHFVNECNERYRSGHDLSLYRDIIGKHEEYHNDLKALLKDDKIYPLIMKTLKAWNMDQRGAKLTTVEKFKQSISQNSVKENLIELSRYKLFSSHKHQIENGILELLENVFLNLKVMETKRRLVGVSKALHFLLPNLVMPIDNKYTMNIFSISTDVNRELDTFKRIFIKSYNITKMLCLTQNEVDGKRWNTSVPKIIDNAIIGFNRYFEDCVNQHSDEAAGIVISTLEEFVSFSPSEKEDYKKLLEKKQNKIIDSRKRKLYEQLIIQKAKESGITVTEDEIEAELARRERHRL
jgi:hypothetical protein